MISNRIYYRLKPYIPWQMRNGARRLFAQAARSSHAHTWPINESAGQKPDGWQGWPGGKKFAFVLTHDVENRFGLARCHQLMALEMKLGFRSIFNFVPEGDYKVSHGLRHKLVQNGFEIGVHDLHHDGKLYWSRRGFVEKAKQINIYLKNWKAVGFRSGFMLHNLAWVHELDISYDMSTFDTDPFEPQPDAANTIFPFWVPNLANEGGYVELPYTLPQDSTLFILFREPSIEIWKKKLDWIAGRGGMALIITHPDYMSFSSANRWRKLYPVAFYEELLDYVKTKYAGAYWHALPREVAEYLRQPARVSARQIHE
jgi:hypothetical protein